MQPVACQFDMPVVHVQFQVCAPRFWYLWYMQSSRGTNWRQYWC
jgi:hypothetical protein